VALAILLLCTSQAHANTAKTILEFAPKETWLTIKALVRDPIFAAAAWAQLAAYSADTGTTAYIFAHCPTCIEGGPLMHGTHSAAKTGLAWGALDIGAIIAAHAMYRHGDRHPILYASGGAMGLLTITHATQAYRNAQFWHAIKNGE
jgi:hypothetical protein